MRIYCPKCGLSTTVAYELDHDEELTCNRCLTNLMDVFGSVSATEDSGNGFCDYCGRHGLLKACEGCNFEYCDKHQGCPHCGGEWLEGDDRNEGDEEERQEEEAEVDVLERKVAALRLEVRKVENSLEVATKHATGWKATAKQLADQNQRLGNDYWELEQHLDAVLLELCQSRPMTGEPTCATEENAALKARLLVAENRIRQLLVASSVSEPTHTERVSAKLRPEQRVRIWKSVQSVLENRFASERVQLQAELQALKDEFSQATESARSQQDILAEELREEAATLRIKLAQEVARVQQLRADLEAENEDLKAKLGKATLLVGEVLVSAGGSVTLNSRTRDILARLGFKVVFPSSLSLSERVVTLEVKEPKRRNQQSDADELALIMMDNRYDNRK